MCARGLSFQDLAFKICLFSIRKNCSSQYYPKLTVFHKVSIFSLLKIRKEKLVLYPYHYKLEMGLQSSFYVPLKVPYLVVIIEINDSS